MDGIKTRGSRVLRSMAVAGMVFGTLAGTACDDDPVSGDELNGRVYGSPVAMGAGVARSYIEMQDGIAVEIGVALTEAALQNLPAPSGQEGGHHVDMHEFLLPLPASNPTPFRLVEVDWNPAGHHPAPLYGAPHFDFHFYTITETQRNTIDPADPAYAAKEALLPPAPQIPTGYIAPEVVAVPRMGVHLVDPTSPEMGGAPFTTTFIFGSWNGELIFAEPMITRDFILSRPDFSAPVAQPQSWKTPGRYPTGYSIGWDAAAGEYRIALTDLVQRGS